MIEYDIVSTLQRCRENNWKRIIRKIIDGFDLGDQLAEKAVGQLSYEIDTEICNMLIENEAQDSDLVWSKTLPVGVNANSAFDVVIHLNHLVNC